MSKELGRIVQGGTYRRHRLKVFRREGQRLWQDVDMGLYRVEGFAFEGNSYQEVVVVRGIGGPDDGKLLVFTQYRFVNQFRPEMVPQPPPEEAPPAVGQPRTVRG